jgi:hypothetical protein
LAAEVPCGRVEAVRDGEVPGGTPNAEAEEPDAVEAEVPDDTRERAEVEADAPSDVQAAVKAAAGPARYRRTRLP